MSSRRPPTPAPPTGGTPETYTPRARAVSTTGELAPVPAGRRPRPGSSYAIVGVKAEALNANPHAQEVMGRIAGHFLDADGMHILPLTQALPVERTGEENTIRAGGKSLRFLIATPDYVHSDTAPAEHPGVSPFQEIELTYEPAGVDNEGTWTLNAVSEDTVNPLVLDPGDIAFVGALQYAHLEYTHMIRNSNIDSTAVHIPG